MTGRLARWSAGHAWLVVGAWAIAAGLSLLGWRGMDAVLTTGAALSSEPDSTRGRDLIDDRLQGMTAPTDILCAEALPGGSHLAEAPLDLAASDLRTMPDLVSGVAQCIEARAEALELGRPPSAAVGPASQPALTQLSLSGTPREAALVTLGSLQTVGGLESRDASVLGILDDDFEDLLYRLAEADLQRADRLGLPIAFLVLVLVVRALVAPLIPILLGVVAVTVAVSLTALIGRFYELSFYVVNMITMIGLAVGIDYALVVVERYREELRAGSSPARAIEIAGARAGRAVLISGTTVIVALAGMLLVPITVFRSVAIGAVVVVAVGVVAAMTLVPALLWLLGERIDWPRRRGHRGASPERAGRGLWARQARFVMRRPIVCVLLVAGALIPLNLENLDLARGISTTGIAAAPEEIVRPRLEIVGDELSLSLLSGVEISVDGALTGEVRQGIARLVIALGKDAQFAPVLAIQWSEAEDLAVISALLDLDPDDPAAIAAIGRLRDHVVPEAFGAAPATVLVSGVPAQKADVVGIVDRWQAPVMFAVLGLSFLILLVAFRSLVVPIKATVMNLLSVGAANGLLVLVFQKGHGAGLLGFQQTFTVEAWVPIFVFCVLFGLSMDYHVFLLSRIREHFDVSRDNGAAVAAGLQGTGGIITGAALIMVVVFAAFATGDLIMFQQLGFGLAAAILIDATIVRSILVPASMALLGRANWYLPTWLAWLPHLGSDGAHLDLPPRGMDVAGD